MRRVRCRPRVRVPRVAPSRLCGAAGCGLAGPRMPRLCHHVDMGTSPTPYISPCLESETMMALMLRYIEGQEEVAYQYARALVRRCAASPPTCPSTMLSG